MKYRFTANTGWSTETTANHSIDIDLEILFAEILKGNHQLQARFSLEEDAIRREIFELILQNIVPKIIEGTGLECPEPNQYPRANIRARISDDAEVGLPLTDEKSLYVRDRMRVILDVKANQPLNAAQALYMGRGSIAIQMTTAIMNLLKKSVLNVSERKTESSFSLDDTGVQSFKYNVKKSSVDEN